MAEELVSLETLEDRSLLIVDDDAPFRTRLGRAMEGRGFDVILADSVTAANAEIERAAPAFAVVDLRLEDGNGLDVVERIQDRRREGDLSD